ncbi:hypothetical protein [Tenacibaculum jejuense]|uniref:Glutaminyl-tRNA synthetase n=1 Tax=Tenacibaculum jejuense TaxID=584609 RepID=A0A238U7C8_9FLAO|nr:hypothetical protein [Tenacibaculum jejuense]SNR14955.1 conserved protein of unknown function [Tenacibaculum jejuense]
MKKSYKNQEEISQELKRLKLKRNIAIEEIKLVKHEFNESLSIHKWIVSAIKTATRIGFYGLARKIIK